MQNVTFVFWFLLFQLPIMLAFGQRSVSVSATVSPNITHTTYSFRYFFPESNGQIVEPIYLNGKRWATGYSAGVSVLYAYAPGWSVSSGIWFWQSTTRLPRLPQAGDGTVALHNRTLRLPLLVNYVSSGKRLSPYYSFGVFIDWPIPSRITVQREGESNQYLQLKPEHKGPIFLGMVGAGIHYKLNEKYVLITQPTFTYNFGQFGGAKDHNPSISLSLQTQIAYRF